MARSRTTPDAAPEPPARRRAAAKRAPRRAKSGAKALPLSAERPLQAQTRLAALLILALAKDFEKNGAAAVTKLRDENPANYLRLVVSLMPKDMHDANLLDEVSDEELLAAIADLRALAAAPREDDADAGKPCGGEPPAALPPVH